MTKFFDTPTPAKRIVSFFPKFPISIDQIQDLWEPKSQKRWPRDRADDAIASFAARLIAPVAALAG